MKIIHAEEIKTIKRPDGRTIQDLCKQNIGLERGMINFISVVHPAHFIEKLHYHKIFYEIFFFLDDALYHINGCTHIIKNGDLIIFEPWDVHGALSTPHQVGIFIMQIPYTAGDKYFLEESS